MIYHAEAALIWYHTVAFSNLNKFSLFMFVDGHHFKASLSSSALSLIILVGLEGRILPQALEQLFTAKSCESENESDQSLSIIAQIHF